MIECDLFIKFQSAEMVLQESQGDVKKIMIRQCGIHADCSAGAVVLCHPWNRARTGI